jgi:hypothetical protein
MATRKSITPSPAKPSRRRATPAPPHAAILLAAEAAGGEGGLVGYLTAQAIASPSSFMTLLGKVLPTQLQGDAASPLQLVNQIERVIVRAED